MTWLVAAGAAASVGGGGIVVIGSARFWRHKSEVERLRQRQRWLTSEIIRYARALERVSQAIELRKAAD